MSNPFENIPSSVSDKHRSYTPPGKSENVPDDMGLMILGVLFIISGTISLYLFSSGDFYYALRNADFYYAVITLLTSHITILYFSGCIAGGIGLIMKKNWAWMLIKGIAFFNCFIFLRFMFSMFSYGTLGYMNSFWSLYEILMLGVSIFAIVYLSKSYIKEDVLRVQSNQVTLSYLIGGLMILDAWFLTGILRAFFVPEFQYFNF